MGVPEKDVVGKKDGAGCNRAWESLSKKWLENNMARDVTEPTRGMRKTWLEKKMALCGKVEGGRSRAYRAD